MLIGLSLSMCVGDIARGKIRIEDVAYILTGTAPLTEHRTFNYVMTAYVKNYWQGHEFNAMRIAHELNESGRLLFPRENNGPVLSISAGHWLSCQQVYQPREDNHADYEWA